MPKNLLAAGVLACVLAITTAIVWVPNESHSAPSVTEVTCPWELFDLRVDPPGQSLSGKVDLLFRYSHPLDGSIVVDFGGTAGTKSIPFSGACETSAGFVVLTVEPKAVGEIQIELRDNFGKVRAKSTTSVPPAKYAPLSITVTKPNAPPEMIDQITWSPNTTIALAMLRAKELKKINYKTRFFDAFGSYLESCQGYTTSGSEYWAVYVDGQYSYFGIDSMLLSPGDRIELKVTGASSHSEEQKRTHQFQLMQKAKSVK
jgi:hypothetical protein